MGTGETIAITDWLFLLIAFWFGSYAYLYVFEQYDLKPLYSYFVLIGLALVHYLWSIAGRERRSGTGTGIRGLYIWLGAYIVYGVLEYLRSPQDDVTTQAFIDLGEAIVLAASFTVFLRNAELLRKFSYLLCIIAIFGCCMNFVDFVTPMFSIDPGRAAGFYGNPNIAGIALALAMMGGIEAVPRWLRPPYLLFCGVGILLTFSRESWMTWGVAVLFLAVPDIRSSRNRVWAIVMIVLTALSAAIFFQGSLKYYVMQTPIARYMTPDTATRIGIGGALLEDLSGRERKAMVEASLHEAEIAPWTGRGLGFSREWNYRVGPHDMYLLFFVEGGVPGLVLFTALMVLIWMCGTGTSRILATQLIVASFFSHNHLDQPAIVMIIAYALSHGDVNRRMMAPQSAMSVPYRTAPAGLQPAWPLS